jgi:alcohol dehydrogenase
MFSQEAFRLGITALPRVLREPDNLEARGQMLLAAALAGTAIENSMLGAAHSAANPLTAHFGVIHGQAVGLVLPAIIRFNAVEPNARMVYESLAATAGLTGHADKVEALATQLENLLNFAGMPRSLAECGIIADRIPMLAEEAAHQWTAQFNPRPVAAADFAGIYQSILEPLRA